jgi:hypothetical protein
MRPDEAQHEKPSGRKSRDEQQRDTNDDKGTQDTAQRMSHACCAIAGRWSAPHFKQECDMSVVSKNTIASVIVGVSLAAFATQSFAQVSPQRRAAIIKCTKQAHMAYPDDDPTAHDGRYQAYEACMTTAGQLP